MDARWIAHLDAHIAGGRIATEAESAETLSWLLKLEPEQRWCLLLSRAPCFNHLVDSDYRRILKLMVELEPDSLQAAPLPPAPCFDPEGEPPPEVEVLDASLPPVPLAEFGQLDTVSRPRPTIRARPAVWLAVMLIAAAAGAGGVWLFDWYAGGQLNAVVRAAQSLSDKLETQRRGGESMLAFLALSTLSRQAAEGRPFVAELAAFQALWGQSEETSFLAQRAEQGVPEAAALIEELVALNESVNSRYRSRAQQTRFPPEPYRAAGELAQLDALRQSGADALAYVRKQDWSAAVERLQGVADAGYRDWRAKAEQWAGVNQKIEDLKQRIWSQLTTGIAVRAAADKSTQQ